jgi:Spy/CpxP family protein refolding chaperone
VIRGGSGRTRLLGAALLGVVFVAGTLVGAAADRVLHAGESVSAERADWDCRPRRGHHTLFDQLDLQPEQRARVDSIMEESNRRVRAFWAEEGAAVRAMVDSTRAEIRGVLTPEQAAAYDRLREEAAEKRGRRARNEVSGPHGPPLPEPIGGRAEG